VAISGVRGNTLRISARRSSAMRSMSSPNITGPPLRPKIVAAICASHTGMGLSTVIRLPESLT